MPRKPIYPILITVLLLILPSPTTIYALGGVTLSAFRGSNVTIDGAIGPSEWFDARRLSFNWASSNSSLTGGGDLWVKNNGADLLVAVRANGNALQAQGSDAYSYYLYILFDNDNNGVVNNNEDGKLLILTFFATPPRVDPVYLDYHYDTTLGRYEADNYKNGTAAGSHTNPGGPGAFTWEFAIPMASIHPEDFTLALDASIGFEIIFAEEHYVNAVRVSSGLAYWEVSYSNGLPSGSTPSANGWSVIVRTDSQAPISDNTPPTINTPTIQPSSPGPNDPVTISVMVTDTGSGVKNVSITYTTDNWSSVNLTLLATYDTTSQIAMVQIPAQQNGGHVAYYLVAFDNAGNRALNNNSGSYFAVDVLVPLYLNSLFYLALAAALAALFALVYLSRRKRPTLPQKTIESPQF